MSTKLIYTICLLMVLPLTTHAQLRLSFFGANNVPLATFDETQDMSVTFNLNALNGEPVDGVYWHIGCRSIDHAQSGYPALLNSSGWYNCGSFPGTGNFTVILYLCTSSGDRAYWCLQTQDDQDSKTITGSAWEGRSPNEYSHILVQLNSSASILPGTPVSGTGCVRYFWIPITWVTGPVDTESSTWGEIKAMYD